MISHKHPISRIVHWFRRIRLSLPRDASTAYLNVQLLIICVCFSLILFGFIWLARKREAAMLQTIGTQKNDLSLALKGTGEAIWTWRLDTQEISQVGFEPLVEGQFPASHQRH